MKPYAYLPAMAGMLLLGTISGCLIGRGRTETRPVACHHNDGKGFASIPKGSTFPVDITRFTKGDYTNAFEVVIDVCRYCHEPVVARTGYSTPIAAEGSK